MIDVADNGIGMPPGVLARVFEPFFTTKADSKGTGLGLSTVRSIVEAAHGRIEVASVEGHGTTFSIFWPLADAVAQGHAAAVGGSDVKNDNRRARRDRGVCLLEKFCDPGGLRVDGSVFEKALEGAHPAGGGYRVLGSGAWVPKTASSTVNDQSTFADSTNA